MKRTGNSESGANLSSARQTTPTARALRRSFRSKRTHQQLHDAADWLKRANVDASYFAMIWIGVGLRIAAEKLEELAAEMLVEDIIKGNNDE